MPEFSETFSWPGENRRPLLRAVADQPRQPRPSMRPLNARVESRAGRATLIIDDQPRAPLLYALTDCPGARWTWEEVPARNLALFASRGVRLFQADLWLEMLLRPDGTMDIELARRQVAGVLAVCPDAKVMLRVHLNPPPAWCEAHPDDCVAYADGPAVPEERRGLERWIGRDNEQPLRASIYSDRWRTWAETQLATFCALLGAAPEGGAVFCLQLAYGVYGEWHQFGFFCHEPDTGVAAEAAYRSWLERRHGSETRLAAAWSCPGLTWSDVHAPSAEEREAADLASLRDPVRRRAVIDYFTFLHEELAEAILRMARTVRTAWPRPVVTATFFGYFYCMFGRQAAGGHLALDRLLAAPELDCICATPAYTPTALPIGGTGNSRGVIDAVRRAGKLWLDEMDRATSVSGCPWDKGFSSTIPDDVAVLRRNLLQPATRGGGAWCYDFGMVAGTPSFARFGTMGWWDEPQLEAEIGRIQALYASRTGRAYTRPADVLVLHDPWSFVATASVRHDPAKTVFGVMPVAERDPVSPLLTDGLVEPLQQSGLVHDEALLSELPGLDLTPYKLVILATTPVLTPAQREQIRTRVAAQGRHVVALGYAGWSDGEALDPALGAALSGMATHASAQTAPRQTLAWGGCHDEQSLPLPFTVAAFSADAEVIGRWADGTPAAVRRAQTDAVWWSLALPPSGAGLWREIGRAAGCRVVNEHNETTLAGDGWVVVHTLAGGPRTLRLPDGPVITTLLPPRSTTVFEAATGQVLLGDAGMP